MNPELASASFRGTKFESKIVDFYMRHAHSNLDFKAQKNRILKIKYKDSWQNLHYLNYHQESRTIEKNNRMNSYPNFTIEELKFFYELGIKLTLDHTVRTSQEVEDWF